MKPVIWEVRRRKASMGRPLSPATEEGQVFSALNNTAWLHCPALKGPEGGPAQAVVSRERPRGPSPRWGVAKDPIWDFFVSS